MKNYLAQVNVHHFDELDLEMQEYAAEFEVPIIQNEGLAFLKQIIEISKPKRILEIGTAIGYSAINMAKLGPLVDTIEIDSQMVSLARGNISKAHLEDHIRVFEGNALDLDIKLLASEYDMLFIDAAKAQYMNFFNRYSELLPSKGIVVTDNLLFHGLVVNEEIESRNLRNLVKKIKNYNEWLANNEGFNSFIYDIGDGMALSIKR